MENIVERARHGEPDALAALWRTHQHLLLRYFRGRGAPHPDDLASQVWIDVATSIHRFDGDLDDFRRWLFTIAHRRLVDEVRRSMRQPVAYVADQGESHHDVAVHDDLDGADDLARALRLVRTLPPDMAEAVLLRVVAELDVSEVATIMGKSEGHVRVLTHRGLQRLRARLTNTESERPDAAGAKPVTDPGLATMDTAS